MITKVTESQPKLTIIEIEGRQVIRVDDGTLVYRIDPFRTDGEAIGMTIEIADRVIDVYVDPDRGVFGG
jgi:hypothetical protein